MSFVQNPETLLPSRSLLTPPEGNNDGVKAVLWNEQELRSGWRLVMYVVMLSGFAALETFLAFRLHLPMAVNFNINASSLLVQEIILVNAAFAAAAIMGRLEGRAFGIYGLPGTGAFKAHFWQGIVWGLAMIAAMVLLIRLLGGFTFGEFALHGAMLWGYAILWGVVFLLVGLFEEFGFRGYAQFTLASGVGFWPAATMLSASFAAIHLGNTGEDRIGALSVFVIGMFFCLTLRRTGNLWFAVGLHAAFDWGETFLFSTPNSGIVVSGHLLNSSFHGPMWLTGGTVGPEGSVMAFAVVAIASVIFSRIYPSQDEEPTSASQTSELL